jgi:hypothetical protein
MTWKFGEHNDNTFGFYYTFSNGVEYYFYTNQFIESAQALEIAFQPGSHEKFTEYISTFFALFGVSLTWNNNMYKLKSTLCQSACGTDCGPSFLLDDTEMMDFVCDCGQSDFFARADLSKEWSNQQTVAIN